MNYWKGLMIAAAIDLGWIMGCPVTATGPEAVPPLDVVASGRSQSTSSPKPAGSRIH